MNSGANEAHNDNVRAKYNLVGVLAVHCKTTGTLRNDNDYENENNTNLHI